MIRRWRKPFVLAVLLCAAILSALYSYRPTAPTSLPLVGTVDYILIEKSLRKMTVFQSGIALKTYEIDLGFSPIGAKSREGDGRTPEGMFKINRRNEGSKFHLSFGLDYPHQGHIKAARAQGVSAGGDIMIHGQPNLLPNFMVMPADWTAGCIAVTNVEIEELFAAVMIGTSVEIRH